MNPCPKHHDDMGKFEEKKVLDICYILCTTRTSVHFFLGFRVHFGRFFGTWFFTDGFLFLVKELGLLTNPCHWIRVLDVASSYMYILL